ncbi:MAG: acyl-ACP--UDP-N-acetylglucosamine O-acyltransferase [Phycisphaerae bacterium]|nr:acyl-ACP--UDP-N-acetylglucosamine O-acyltransferase [Phycisphaerae bacterium]
MPKISPLSEVSPAARIADDVEIGPFCVVGPEVTLGAGCKLMNNVTIIGRTTIGRENVFYPFVVIGTPPQDLKFRGTATRIEIGDRNAFREYVTVHPGTEAGGELTRVGSDSLFMIGSHIAHDCLLDDKVMLGNYSQLAGHVRMEHNSVLSALSGVHHFVTIGKYAFIGGLTAVKRDIPPFTIFDGSPGRVRAINKTGICRNGLTAGQVEALESAFRRLFNKRNDQLAELAVLEREDGLDENVGYLCAFLRASLEGKFGRHREVLRMQGDKTAWTPGALGQKN